MLRRITGLALLAALVGFTAVSLLAQRSTGTIRGTVTDSSGATVPGAEVRIINEGTNVVRTLETPASGLYVAANTPPGNYRVEVDREGFQPQVKVGLILSIDQVLVVDFELEPGALQEVITVVGRSEQLVQTATSSLGETIEEAQIRDLPLNGRNFQSLIGLTSGAQPGPPGTFSENKFYINGGRGEGNAYLIDGLDVSSPSGDQIRVFPSLESIGEFKIITNNFSAEYTRSLSGVVNVHIKSGTNDFHGTLFHFLRNRVLDARNFFAAEKPQFIFNQFGGSIGGPIVKNKLFFFTDYQGTRTREGGPRLLTVPPPAVKNGDFSASAAMIHDPLTFPREPFPNNIIPQGRFDPASARMFSLLPDPNQAGPFNFATVQGSVADEDAFDVRGDWNVDESNRLSVVYTYKEPFSASDPILGPLSGNLITTQARIEAQSVSVNYTRIIGTRAVNELVVGLKRDNFFGPPTAGMQFEPDLGVRFLNTSAEDRRTTGFPLFIIPGLSLFGGPAGGPFRQVHNIPQITDNFSWNVGRHAFKTGFAIKQRQFNLDQSIWPRGLLVFNSLQTADSSFQQGSATASALLGYPLVGQRDIAQPWGERLWETGFYIQDDWKVNQQLTLNLGLRYDIFPPAFEQHDRVANFDPETITMVLAATDGRSRSLLDTDYNNFGPRLGFAYQLGAQGNTVIRGGYGIAYLPLQTSAVGTGTDRLTTNQPFRTNFSAVFDFINPTVRVSDGLELPVPDPNNPTGSVVYMLEDDPTPSMQQWNLNIQRELPLNFLFEAAYSGSKGSHLTGMVNINQAPPGATPPGPRSPISPNLNIVEGLFNRESSAYHGLQLKLQRRFVDGFYLLTAYTWSKSIDDGSFATQGSSASSVGPQNSFDWRAERALSDFDIRQRLVVSYIYELPFGKGKPYITQGALSHILGGWQINGITTLQTGTPFTPIVSNSTINAGSGGDVRPDRIADGELPSSSRAVERWFDLSAFDKQSADDPDPFRFGNSGRNIIEGPGRVNFDFSLFRKFSFTERWKLEFRTEFFNLFNHPNFSLPSRSIDTPQGGVISAAFPARQIQFGLKLIF